MPQTIIRRLKPEEEEVRRKREELVGIRTALAERELDLVDLRKQLAALEGQYFREVGTLYAELDEWKARISELQARLYPSAASKEQAEQAREQARQTYKDANGEASERHGFTPSPELRSIYREAAKRIHPDLATGPADRERRTRFMAEANCAYEAGDADAIQHILDEFEEGSEAIEGEGVSGELIRIIRQISQAKQRIADIEEGLAKLLQSEIGLLKKQAEDKEREGRDLLSELATAVQEQIEFAKNKYELLTNHGVCRRD